MKTNGVKLLKDERVVVASKSEKQFVVTSQGPGTALDFSFTLVDILFGKEKAQGIAKAMLHDKGYQGFKAL